MGRVFPEEFGVLSAVPWTYYQPGIHTDPWYADSEIYCLSVSFSVPYDEWNEFQNSQLYRDINQYVKDCEKRTRDKIEQQNEQICTEEIEALPENQTFPVLRESVWARIGRIFRKK